MKPLLFSLAGLLVAAVCTAASAPAPAAKTAAVPASTGPIRALLVTGGCCHDYDLQTKALTEGSQKFGAFTWTVVNEGGKGTDAQIPLYNDPNWAKPYDVIVHNECFANTADAAYIRKITAAHKAGKPAVVVHCAMHSYRAATIDDWREFLGVTSRKHDHQSRYPVRPVVPTHPALRDFPAIWTTPMDELYVIEKLWPKATTLATSISEKNEWVHPVIWVNDYHGTRVFGTTFGHSSETWQDPVFITLLSRGLLWAAGRE